MADKPVVNLDQILCQKHGDDVLELGWAPLYERWIHSQPGCEDCMAKVRRIPSPDGRLKVIPWLDVPNALGLEQVAGHEAAHAVVGKHRGIVVNSAWVGHDEVEVGGRSTARGGAIDYEPFTGPLSDLAAMASAGWAADRVWLKAQGLEGNRAAELAAAQSAGIDMNLLFDLHASMDVYLDAKRDADELVREHKREIRAVQDELIRHQHLGAEAITAAMDLAHRRTAAPSNTNTPKTSGETTTGTPQTAPPLAGAGASTTSSSGGTGMAGIEEIAIAVSQTTEDSERMRAALMEVQQLAEQTTGRLGTVLGDSSQPEVHEGISAFSQVAQQVVELVQLAAGATDGLQSYRNRL